MMNQDRLKSKVVWMAILAQVVIVMQVTGILPTSDIEVVNVVVTAIIQVLVLIGVLNNPTNSEKF